MTKQIEKASVSNYRGFLIGGNMDKKEEQTQGEAETPKIAETKPKWQKQPFYPISDFSNSDDPLVQAQKDYE